MWTWACVILLIIGVFMLGYTTGNNTNDQDKLTLREINFIRRLGKIMNTEKTRNREECFEVILEIQKEIINELRGN